MKNRLERAARKEAEANVNWFPQEPVRDAVVKLLIRFAKRERQRAFREAAAVLPDSWANADLKNRILALARGKK